MHVTLARISDGSAPEKVVGEFLPKMLDFSAFFGPGFFGAIQSIFIALFQYVPRPISTGRTHS